MRPNKGLLLVVHPAATANGPAIDLRGKSICGVHVPVLGTASTVAIEVSMDGALFTPVRDTALAQVGLWASSTGAFSLDVDTLARLGWYPYWRFVFGATQAAAVTFTVSLGS